MESISYRIGVFEGPMDLLLYLISKHKLNIHDIPIVELVEQYTAYIRQMKEENLDVASEFLEMAARLVHIKTVSLLPVYEEGEILRRELTGELIEYAQCKQVAKALSEQTDGFDCMDRPQQKIKSDMTYTRVHDPFELLNAYMRVVGKRLRKMPPPFDSFRIIVAKTIVSVSVKIKQIINRLTVCGNTSFTDMIKDTTSRSDMVATFLAVLELAKTGHIHVEGDGENVTVQLISVPEGDIDFE